MDAETRKALDREGQRMIDAHRTRADWRQQLRTVDVPTGWDRIVAIHGTAGPWQLETARGWAGLVALPTLMIFDRRIYTEAVAACAARAIVRFTTTRAAGTGTWYVTKIEVA